MKFNTGSLSNRDRARLEQAKRIASTSSCGKKHGAVAVKGGRVVGVGVNSYQNDESLFEILPYNLSTHAEQACLRAIGNNARGATIYVARVSRTGEERMSKPCSACQKALKLAGVRRVVYTIESELTFDQPGTV
jgi:tRNA(Arg) A34 adenosine deaminase TadA